MMRKIFIILSLFFFHISIFAQWKSHYPEGTARKKTKEIDLDLQKKTYKSHFFNALKAKSLEEYEQALILFDKCIKIDKNSPSPFYEMALINFSNRNFEIALTQIQSAVNLNPENRWYSLLYAEILFNQNNFANAAEQYKRLINMEPGNEELYFKLSDTYIYANDLKKAISVYNDLQSHKGFDKALSMQKHKLYRELNDLNGAIKELVQILKVFPNDIDIMEIISELYLLNDEKEKAFELFKEIAIIEPNNGRIHLTLADYYRDNDEKIKSYEELKLAFKSTELSIDTKVRILISYFQLISSNEDMKNQANELSEILIEVHPNNLKARAVFADILYVNGKYHEANKQYLLILEKEKSKSSIWSQILFIQAEQKDFEGMLMTSSEALQYFPADPLFYYFNAVSNKWHKNYEQAIKSLEIGIDFIFENQSLLLEYYTSLADINHLIKNHEISDKYYEKVLLVDSTNLIALNNYSYYLALRKTKLLKAKKMSFKCNKLEPENSTYQDTYAWILYQLEDYKNAKEWLLKALLNGGDKSAVVVEHYGDILFKIGDINKAIEQWKKARNIVGESEILDKKINSKMLHE